MSPDDFDRSALLVAVLTAHGMDDVPEGGNRAVRCIYHDDRHQSASVNTDEGVYKCFTCSVSGDAFALIMQKEGIGFREALGRAEALAGEGGTGVPSERRQGRFLSARTRDYQNNGRSRKAGRSHRTRRWS